MFDTQLSDFIGPDENPLSEGGNWAQSFSSRAPLRRFGNKATTSSTSNPNYSHWTTTFNFDDGGDVFACTQGGQLGAALETWRVTMWQTVGGTNVNGYELYMGGGLSKPFVLSKYVAGVQTVLCTTAFHGYPQMIGINLTATDVEAWSMFGGTWGMECSGPDVAFRGDLYIGAALEDPSNGGLYMSCFGGGPPVEVRRQQIYRVLRGHRPASVPA